MLTEKCEVCGQSARDQEEQEILDRVGLCRDCNPAHYRPRHGHIVVANHPWSPHPTSTPGGYQRNKTEG